jgi:hypothetical protein
MDAGLRYVQNLGKMWLLSWERRMILVSRLPSHSDFLALTSLESHYITHYFLSQGRCVSEK